MGKRRRRGGRAYGGDGLPTLRLGADDAVSAQLPPPSLDCRGIAGQPVWLMLCMWEGRVSGVELPSLAIASIAAAAAWGEIAWPFGWTKRYSEAGPAQYATGHLWFGLFSCVVGKADGFVCVQMVEGKASDLGRWRTISFQSFACIALDHCATTSRATFQKGESVFRSLRGEAFFL